MCIIARAVQSCNSRKGEEKRAIGRKGDLVPCQSQLGPRLRLSFGCLSVVELTDLPEYRFL